MRFLLVLMLGMAGCVATLPTDPAIPADLACELARGVVQMRAAPSPDNAPKPGDKCTNCEGRGYVGDGTVRVPCQPCGGTGRLQ